MLSNISILIINSSHKSIDNITSILKAKILSKQRPHITCLSYTELNHEGGLKNFMEAFVNQELSECRVVVENIKKKNEFNLLEIWKSEMNKRRISSRIELKNNKLCTRNSETEKHIILDSSDENDFFLILFDVYDCEVIKSIAAFDRSSLLGLVNLYARNEASIHESSVKHEWFWQELLRTKHTKYLENMAFVDFHVPVDSNYILNIRSQLIYDQFCHFFYDFEHQKLSYRRYRENLVIHDVNIQEDDKDFKQFQKRLNETPHYSVEDIYEAIMEHIAQDGNNTLQDENSMDVKFMDIEAFGKRFYDINDVWRKGYAENSKFYSHKIRKLEKSCDDIWNNIETQISIEQKQVLNYFMNKITRHLECNEKDYDSIEFYFYVLQFKNWHHAENHEKEFHENRSVGHKRKTNDKRYSRKVTSDSCIEYRNTSTIPPEIEQLVNDGIKMDEMEDFYIQFLSRSAMLQHICDLRKTHKIFHRQYSKIFDVLLIKFPMCTVPEVFSSKVYRKTLPTPLCFRDFIDYRKFEVSNDNRNDDNNSTKNFDKKKINVDDFILPMSIKYERKSIESTAREHENGTLNDEKNEKEKKESDCIKMETVYNVCNNRIEFQIEESKFQSSHLDVKASIFSWLNAERHLNFTCTLHERVQLSYSRELHTTNGYNNVTLRDEHGSGMICSIDCDISSNKDNMMLSFPHGMMIKIIGVDSVEMNWMELMEDSHDMKINNGNVETKRTYFSNGFIMLHMLNGTVKIYSSNGTIFDLISNKDVVKRNRNEELTKIHQFSITSIHFLRKYVNISAFVMTLPTGMRFIVENDWIVDEMKPLLDVHEYRNEDKGNYNIVIGGGGGDGVKVQHTNIHTKCLLNDETIMTKTFYCEEDIATTFDSDNVKLQKPISILDELWLTEAENESKILMDDVLNFVNDEYYVKINHSWQLEHRKYGMVRFMRDKIEMELFNGVAVTKGHDNSSISINGVKFKMNNSNIEFFDEKCTRCCGSNKVIINTQIATAVDDVNGDDEYTNQILISASDVDKNLFQIDKKCRQVFYETWEHKDCQLCKTAKETWNKRKFGEHWIVLNRDMSGYEILKQNPTSHFNHITSKQNTWMETDDTILLCCHDDIYEINIDDDSFIDFKIENEDEKGSRDGSIKSTPSTQTLNGSSTSLMKRRSRVSANRNRIKSKKQQNSITSKTSDMKLAEIDNSLDMTSPWVTIDDSSISHDIVCGRQMIQFYANPLLDLPESISVSAYFKLHNNKFTDIVQAMCHLKKHSREKFIINVDGLMKNPVEMRSFLEHFKFIVKRSIEGYIDEKLEQFRMNMARVIMEDLLENALKGICRSSKIDTHPSHDKTKKESDGNDDSAQIIPLKSFSFV